MKESAIIDRTSLGELLPIFMNRGIFTNYKALPEKAGLIDCECNRLGIAELPLEQERELLSEIGTYKTNNYVVRDYGDYAIAFCSKMYIDYLEESESRIEDELLRNEYTEEKIHNALEKYSISGSQHGTSGNSSERLRAIASQTSTTKANVATALQMISWGLGGNACLCSRQGPERRRF